LLLISSDRVYIASRKKCSYDAIGGNQYSYVIYRFIWNAIQTKIIWQIGWEKLNSKLVVNYSSYDGLNGHGPLDMK